MGGPSKPKTPPQPDPEEERRKARREAEAIAQEDEQTRARYGRRSTVLGGARRRSTVLGPGGGVSAGRREEAQLKVDKNRQARRKSQMEERRRYEMDPGSDGS